MRTWCRNWVPRDSCELSWQMKDRFVLCGPQDRTEGRNESSKQQLTITTSGQRTNHDQMISEPIAVSEPNMETSLVNMLENNADIDMLKEIHGHYQEDPIFKSILEKPRDFRDFNIKNSLIYLKLNRKDLLCIPKMIINGRNLYKIIISQAHSILAHLGAAITLSYLQDHVWWKEMVSDTKSYCKTCVTCKRSKPNNQKPYRLLNPFAIPSNHENLLVSIL